MCFYRERFILWKNLHYYRPSFADLVLLFERLLIIEGISDRDASTFWQKYFVIFEKDVCTDTNKEIILDKVAWDERDLSNNRAAPHEFKKPLLEELGLLTVYRLALSDPRKQELVKRLIALKKLLCVNDMVTLERFGKIVDTFGPFTLRSEHDMSMLDKIYITMQEPWFRKDITIIDAVHELEYEPIGTYLVRISGTASRLVISTVIRYNY